MKPHEDSHGRGPRWAAPLVVALIWGVNVPVMKAALAFVHPFAFNALRLSLSAVALGLVDRSERAGRRAKGSDEEAEGPTPWPAVVALGLLTSLAYQVLFIEGMARTSASHAGFLIASGPLWTAMIARLLGVERVGRRAWLGLAVAFVGTSLVATARGPAGATLFGNGLVLASMVTWGLATVLSRPLLARIPATRLAFLFTCVSLPGHWWLAWPHLAPLWSADPAAVGPTAEATAGPMGAGGWAAVVYSGLFSTGIAYALWNRSLLRIGPARTSAFTNLVPLVALVLAWAALGERPGPVQLVGGALILIGIGSWRSTRPRAARAGA